jgi:hypothetical protein
MQAADDVSEDGPRLTQLESRLAVGCLPLEFAALAEFED